MARSYWSSNTVKLPRILLNQRSITGFRETILLRNSELESYWRANGDSVLGSELLLKLEQRTHNMDCGLVSVRAVFKHVGLGRRTCGEEATSSYRCSLSTV